ncbi:hypothetical protein IV203_008929 [Nitzschia inconspicua]|uniref:Uncharacterized protein n=1 Tax=Nitzschia inconspicua TaxID=303405 RepID=A0A9K3L141_9STRA|nr:hypothetical protein IV203_008929 [Nitzschia inconspicua]
MGKFTLDYFEKKLEEMHDKIYKKAPGIKATHRKAFVEACEIFHDGDEAMQNATDPQESEKCAKAQTKAMKKCVKAGGKIFENLDMTSSATLESAILKGTMIAQATPQGLADWVAEDERHELYMNQVMSSTDMLKFMLTHGGPKDGKWGQAIKIYFEICNGFPDDSDDLTKVFRKIAMAVALELATPICEFDTKIQVDPVKRYQHYADAYKNGELDPAFPHFSVWEMRHIINCNATDEQLAWGRKMMMNYAPYITTLTDLKLRYNYILETDVFMRNPTWTSSPRTYQQVLSGGGKDKPNAWFGRFICKAFGIPTWGCTQPKLEAFIRWTPSGWVPIKGAQWEECSYEGVSGIDFQAESSARAGHTSEDYYKQIVLLEALADMMDAKRGESTSESDKNIIHPMKLWRSLCTIQKALMLEAVTAESFERSGEGVVKTKVEKYLEIFESDKDDTEITNEDGIVTIPAAAHGYSSGNKIVIACMDGGKQLNFMADGVAEYELPDDVEPRTYTLTLEVCTVHLKQTPLKVTVNDLEEVDLEIPYTVGEWQKTKGLDVTLSGDGDTIRIARARPAFGMAIRRLVLE